MTKNEYRFIAAFLVVLVLMVADRCGAQDCRPNISAELKGSDYYALPAWDKALTFIQPADEMQDLFPGFAFFLTQPQWEPLAIKGAFYCSWIAADGGTPPYVYSASKLPAGLVLDTVSGQISGILLVKGSYTDVVYTVTDSTGLQASIIRYMRVCVAGEFCDGFN